MMHARLAPLVTASRRPIAQLLHDLRALGDLRRRAAEVDARLEGLRLPLAPLAPRLPFAHGRYARILLHRDACFELLLLTWSAGSTAPAHDHDDQDCWFVPVAGAFNLTDYAILDEERGRAHLVALGSRRLGEGELDRRDASAAIHAVTPAAPLAVSLHLYARPLDRCRIFDLGRGTFSHCQLRYDCLAPELAG